MFVAINNNRRRDMNRINWPLDIRFLPSSLAVDRKPLISKWGGVTWKLSLWPVRMLITPGWVGVTGKACPGQVVLVAVF